MITEEWQIRRQGIAVGRASGEINGFIPIAEILVCHCRPIKCNRIKLVGLRQLCRRGFMVAVCAGEISGELMNPAPLECSAMSFCCRSVRGCMRCRGFEVVVYDRRNRCFIQICPLSLRFVGVIDSRFLTMTKRSFIMLQSLGAFS